MEMIDLTKLRQLKKETMMRGAGDYDRDTILALIDIIEVLLKLKGDQNALVEN